MQRRTFLQSAGALTILVAGGGVWRAHDQGLFSVGKGAAYAPWEDWKAHKEEGVLGLIRAALLAANPHNTQPWLFRVRGQEIEIHADPRKHLGTMDPYFREMHIGLGCAIENLCLAAQAQGLHPKVLMPAAQLGLTPHKDSLVAKIQLSPAKAQASPLYEAIPHRHTNRYPYQSKPVSKGLEDELHKIAAPFAQAKLVLFSKERAAEKHASFGKIVIESTQAICLDPKMSHDSHRWFRHTGRDIEQHRDGITLDSAGLPSALWLAARMLPPSSEKMANDGWQTSTKRCVEASPVFGLITISSLYDRPQNLEAGRLWQRLHLWASTQGLAMQPLNQPVEMVDRDHQLRRKSAWGSRLSPLLQDPKAAPTFAFRMGYPQRQTSSSPRRPLKDIVLPS
ncbi:MAG: hypothetical protein H6728_05180 [Myxococcales bacterium]|nr:hypothetical protein [Myxococcales bacterium]